MVPAGQGCTNVLPLSQWMKDFTSKGFGRIPFFLSAQYWCGTAAVGTSAGFVSVGLGSAGLVSAVGVSWGGPSVGVVSAGGPSTGAASAGRADEVLNSFHIISNSITGDGTFVIYLNTIV